MLRPDQAAAGACDPACGILAIMPELILKPSRVAAAGQPPKLIDEYVGRASTGQAGLSIAHMRSPYGWAEPGQRPEFDEFTIVLRGALVVESDDGQMTVQAGQGVHAQPGEWVRYSTREPTAPSTSRSACPPSPLTRFTGMNNRADAVRCVVLGHAVRLSACCNPLGHRDGILGRRQDAPAHTHRMGAPAVAAAAAGPGIADLNPVQPGYSAVYDAMAASIGAGA